MRGCAGPCLLFLDDRAGRYVVDIWCVGMGIGRIGGSAMEAIGRQPDAYGKIQTAMLIAAALVEGIGFAALFAV